MLVMMRDALAAAGGQHGPHPLVQQRVVAGGRILQLGALRQRDRALGQAFEDQVVDPALFGQLDGGLDAVARNSRHRRRF